MPIFGAPRLSAEDQLASYARVLVRAGDLDLPSCLREVTDAARHDVPTADAEELGHRFVTEARDALYLEQESWPARTEHDELQAAFADLRDGGIFVRESVEDHWQAEQGLEVARRSGEPPRGVVWFTAPDVWHAVEHGMLEMNVWHGDSANIAEGDELLDTVLATLARHGLRARYDEGRVEVDTHWRRRLRI